MATTIHSMKIDAARDCIRGHLSHVQGEGNSDVYASRQEALQTARKIISRSQIDASQIHEAFKPWKSEEAVA